MVPEKIAVKKILHACNHVCDRSARVAACQMAVGHQVDMVWPCKQTEHFVIKAWAKERDHTRFYSNVFQLTGTKVMEVADQYDAVFCHAPECWEYVSFHRNAIVDCHDFYGTDGRGSPYEHKQFTEAKKFVFVTEGMKSNAAKLYGEKCQQSVCVPNVPPLGWLATRPDPIVRRRSRGMGRGLHIVYEGGHSVTEGHHRNFLQLFRRIANIRDVRLHLYLPFAQEPYVQMANECERVIMHEPVGWEEVANELALYDVNFCAFCWPNDWANNTSTALPGKIGQACAVGTPTLIEVNMPTAAKYAGGLAKAVSWKRLMECPECELRDILYSVAKLGPIEKRKVPTGPVVEDWFDEIEELTWKEV